MFKVVHGADLELRPDGTVKFEGASHGSQVSFFHVKNDPGMGASLHVHPYSETWIVLRGSVRFTVGGEGVEADAGKIVVAEANIPHKFTNVGVDTLEMVCIHPSSRIVQEDMA